MIHLVDLSDHCSHSDRNLSPVNFLQFSDQQWGRMAGCGTAYHNRMRRPEYRKLIETSGFRLIAEEERVPQKALDALTTLTLAEPRWKSMSERELACSNWLVLYSDPTQIELFRARTGITLSKFGQLAARQSSRGRRGRGRRLGGSLGLGNGR